MNFRPILYPLVPGFQEVDRVFTIGQISFHAVGHGRGLKIIERRKEFHGGGVRGEQVLQMKECHISPEISEKLKKIRVTGQNIAQWAFFAGVVSANAFQGVVEAIFDSSIESPRLVNGSLSVNLDRGEDHHPANGVSQTSEISHFIRNPREDIRQAFLFSEGGDHGITRQAEPPSFRIVMQIEGRVGFVKEGEHGAVRQRFAPKKFVVCAERRAPRVWIFSRRCVGPEIESGVDGVALVHRVVVTISDG